MELIPAIDILDGKVVRLHKGDYDAVTVYADNPAEQAARFAHAGARRLHVVDLDGARAGRPCNVDQIKAIVETAGLSVQVGGGVRTRQAAERWFDSGVARVVLGTAAIRDASMVQALCEAHAGGIVVAVDARGGEVAIEGWLEGSGRSALDFAREVDGWGAAAILHTVIERDGTREGPDIEATLSLQAEVRATVIASGGIGTLEHIRSLARAGARAAVCGRALLSGAFALQDAFAAAHGED